MLFGVPQTLASLFPTKTQCIYIFIKHLQSIYIFKNVH